MFAVLYKWRIDPQLEDQFIENWIAVTKYFHEECGSLGSRLHKGSDGAFYGYAQWPNSETREVAQLKSDIQPAWNLMREAVAESFPETPFEVIADLLESHPAR